MGSDNFTNINKDNSIINSLTKFNGFYSNVYRDPFINGNAFVFVTRPSLFIENIKPNITDSRKTMAYLNMTRDPVFTQFLKNEQLNEMDDNIVSSLSYIDEKSASNFLPIFTNECKSFDVTDLTLETEDLFTTKQGYKQILPTYKTLSEGAGQLTIGVTEDSNLSFTKMLTLWVNYINNVVDGTFDANPDMVLNGRLDYMSSIYYFVLGPDGRSIKYWCRYTGCYPTTVPYSSMNYSKGNRDPIDLSIQFTYTLKEDMNPKILEEFNMVSFRMTDQSRPETPIQNYYASIRTSPLLNRSVMLDAANYGDNRTLLLSAKQRDPIVLLRESSKNGIHADATSATFDLLFDEDGYRSEFMDAVFEEHNDAYYFNDTATIAQSKDGVTWDRWDTSPFWDE